jgi:hypothetical protein
MTGPGPRLASERLPEVTATPAAHAAEDLVDGLATRVDAGDAAAAEHAAIAKLTGTRAAIGRWNRRWRSPATTA